MFNEFIIIVIIVNLLIKHKLFHWIQERYRKIINNTLTMIIKNIIGNKGLDFLIINTWDNIVN